MRKLIVQKIPEIYEAAVKRKPKNDELLSHLFMSYVRTEDYKKQQQTALALHKVVPSNPYYSWAVMSIVMQVLYVCLFECVRMCVSPLAMQHMIICMADSFSSTHYLTLHVQYKLWMDAYIRGLWSMR